VPICSLLKVLLTGGFAQNDALAPSIRDAVALSRFSAKASGPVPRRSNQKGAISLAQWRFYRETSKNIIRGRAAPFV
jgi:hypothetical protein